MIHEKQVYSYGFKVFWACLCLLVFGVSTPLHAQVQPADEPCDPEYYDSLEARAWLEAQREITQNQNLIFKPDSVLEYTCFDRYLNELAEHAKTPMFSETTRWGELLPDDSMDNALESLVGTAFRNYLDQNYDHTFLGGRTQNLDYSPDNQVRGPDRGGTAYACDMMNKVWMEAKCMDFIQNQDEDGFYTFKEYQNDPDKRFLPERCSAIAARWGQNINEATVDSGTKWEEDTVETYLDRLDPSQCGQRGRPNAPAGIPTGLIVKTKNFPKGFEERVCIRPGCHYVPQSGGRTGDCVPSK